MAAFRWKDSDGFAPSLKHLFTTEGDQITNHVGWVDGTEHGGRWLATLAYNGRIERFGPYDTLEEAKAVLLAVVQLDG